MESRMEKYYTDDISNFERTKKNQKLYRDVSGEISGLDNLPIPDNSNEIDIDSLKKIISSRDEYRKNKVNEDNNVSLRSEEEKVKESKRVYDINVLLENAKSEITHRDEFENKTNINSNFLTNLEEANIPDASDAIETSFELPKKDVVSNTDSLPLDILADLKGDDNTIVTDPIIKEEVTMIKSVKDGETFYSGSFNFSKKDFEQDDDEPFFEESSHTGIKVFFLIFGFLILAAAIYFIITKYVL